MKERRGWTGMDGKGKARGNFESGKGK